MLQATRHEQSWKHFGRLCAVIFLLLLGFTVANSQTTSPTDGSTPLGLSPGSPSGSHALSGFESVNPYNGNLNIQLPLISIGGRGGAGTGSVLSVDSKGWTVRHQETTDMYGYPVDVYTPVPNPWVPKPGYGPGFLVARKSGKNANQNCYPPGGGVYTKIYQQTLTRLTFTTSDGTEYEFRDQLTGGQPATVSNPCASTGASRGTVFVTADGTAATFISDAVIYDRLNSTGSGLEYPYGYLMLRDGTRYRIDGGFVSWLRDRNGNKLTFTYSNGRITTITDSLKRQVSYTYANFSTTFSDQITLKGFGGATRVILVNYGPLTNALRTTNPRNEPASRYQLQTYYGLFPELNNASQYSTWNPWVVTSVTLPNSQQYQFKYNCFAEVARINLPTSGAIEYDYTAGSGAIGDGVDYQVYRRVKERRVYPDGTNLESYSTYSASINPVSIDQLSANGTLLARAKHFYYGSPVDSLFNASGISYSSRLEGREYKTEAYAADGITLLRRTETIWANRAAVSWWWNPGDASEPPNDLRVTDMTSTLADVTPNLVSKQTFGYDDSVPYNNRNNIKEFGFGNGVPGAMVRETTTSFITSGTYTGTSVHLRSLPSQVSVYDSNGIERARTTYEYDNYNADANHAALLNRANISGFDSSFNTSYTTRGNATATTSYLLTNGTVTSSVSGYAQYDIAGNVVKAIDALGNVTNFNFNDCFGAPDGNAQMNAGSMELNAAGQYSYALATSVTKSGQTSFLQFDYYLGRPVDAEDANGTVYTGYSVNDALDRPTQIVSASGPNTSTLKSQSTFSYDDSNRTVTVTRDKSAYGDNLLKGTSFYDGLGRTIEARTYENGTDYITAQQRPFVLRQDPDTGGWVAATESSNPYRSYLGESAVWTTTFTDALGRTTKVRTPDSAITRTSYSGNTATVSDQTGKARKSVSDALGRLVQVNEDPASLNYLTTNEYDALSNLTKVTQDNNPQQPMQPPRTFAYDSLKRLRSTTNPENGTVSYIYDNGGNVLVKTDARGVSTHFAYDQLNRVTRRWYNGSSSTSATTHNSPVLPSSVGTSSEANFYYDAQTLPAGAPSFSRGSATGRLVAVTYGGSGSSAGDYFGYDALGRAVLKIQQTGGVFYQTTANYSLSGALNSEVYPSNRTVNYGYDGAGRTTSFSGSLGGETRSYSTGIVYSALGGMTKEQFGTDTAIYNKLFYNVRGQLSEIRESTAYTGPSDTSWNRGAIINHYSECWGMCGGSNSTTSMTDNNGNLKKQDVYIPNNEQNTSSTSWWQRYDYDNLNRLTQVTEISGSTPLWQQAYTLDRYGNRTIDYNNTSASMPRPQFGVNTSTNRLTAPAGYTMSYDSVGNLTNDTYSGQGQRTYDAENRMTQAWANSQWQTYTYDASGQRVRRNANGVETWAVYGLGGEMLAEYAASGAPSSPQKEYGYRNGQLLVTAETALPEQNVSWTSVTSTLQVTGNSLQKTSGTSSWYDAGAVSTQSITSGDGYVEFTPGNTTTWRMIGLGNGNTGIHYSDIEYALFVGPSGGLQIYEAGILRGSFGTYAGADRLRVAVEGGVVKYRKNGALVYTSTVAPTYPLLVDTSFNTVNSAVYSVVLAASSSGIKWLVTDQLGTPRMIFDKTGALASVSRHDYLPFGEELFANAGSRTTTQGFTMPGYNPADKARQKFTGQERDSETGLDYMHARYFASAQGSFTSADTFGGSVGNPQSLNRYAYVGNNPMNFSDPTGHMPSSGSAASIHDGEGGGGSRWDDPTSPAAELRAHTALPADYEGRRSQLYSKELEHFRALADLDAAFQTLDNSMRSTNNWAYGGVSVSAQVLGVPDTEAFVVDNPDSLERGITAGNVQYLDDQGIAQCARLPLAWQIDQEGIFSRINRSKRLSENWTMGVELFFGMKLSKGTVVATFNITTGQYAQTNASEHQENHTAVFLRWEVRNKVQGMVVGQQMAGLNGRAEIGFIPFQKGAPYFRNAYRFNVVMIPWQRKYRGWHGLD